MLRLLLASFIVGASVADAAPAAPPPGQTVSNWDVFLKLYPARALAAREEGLVGFLVTLNNRGDVTRCQVTHTSGHPLLDEETCKLITLNAVFKPDPALSPSQTKTHEGVINWKLPASAFVAATPQPVTAKTVPEHVVCKKTVRVGTLAGFERACMTPSEWAKQSDEQKQTWDELQGRKGSSKCNMGGATC